VQSDGQIVSAGTIVSSLSLSGNGTGFGLTGYFSTGFPVFLFGTHGGESLVTAFRDGFGVEKVILVRLAIGLNKLGWHEPHLVPLLSQRGTHEMRSRAGLQADQRRTQFGGIG